MSAELHRYRPARRVPRWGILAASLFLGLAAARPLPAQGVFIRGDCDGSFRLDITDAITGLSYLFLGGARPICLDACDADDSEVLDITDAIRVLGYLFLGSAAPPAPFPLEDPDPSGTALTCANGLDPPVDLLVAPREVSLFRIGNVQVLAVVARYAQGTLEDVRASPSTRYEGLDSRIAEISNDGIITARAVGTTSIRVRFRGLLREVAVRVLPGADGGPVIRIISPADGSIITSPRALLSGVVSDPAATLTVGGSALANRSGSFQTTVELAAGLNVIDVEARGAAGTGRAAVRVTRAAPGSAGAIGPDRKPLPVVLPPGTGSPDSTAPAIAITAPAAGATLLSGLIEVSGTIDDPTASVRVSGAAATVEGGAFAARLRLPAGAATLRAEAVDPVGNLAAATVAVTVDDAVLRVTITDPAELIAAAPGGTTSVAARGLVEPAGAMVDVNGVAATVVGTTWNAPLTLEPGAHDLFVTARLPGAAPRAVQAVRSVYVDAEGPDVRLAYPPEERLLTTAGHRVETSSVRFAGRVRDPGVPRDLEGALQVAIGGVAATVSGESFIASVPVAPGANTLELVASDARGKQTRRTYKVVRGGSAGITLTVISGDGANLQVGQAPPAAISVEARDATGATLRGLPLELRVVQGDGTLDGGLRSRLLTTGADGRVTSLLGAGGEAGAAPLVVTVTGPQVVNAPLGLIATVDPATARVLVPHRRRLHAGAAGVDLPSPVEVRLLDGRGNGVRAASVLFTVVEGGARIGTGVQSTVLTDASGLARVVVRPPAGADSRSVLTVTHTGAETLRLEVQGLRADPAADTTLSGAVGDERGQPIPDAIVRLLTASGAIETVADVAGAFLLDGIPAGAVVLEAEAPGRAPLRAYAFAAQGRENRLPQPLRLLLLEDSGRQRTAQVSPSLGASLLLNSMSGARLEIAAGAARFPDGTRAGAITLAALGGSVLASPTPDDVPLEALLAVLPEGVRFDPPATLTLPNVRDAAGRAVPLFVHDALKDGFHELAAGIVGEDGVAVVCSGARGLRSGGLVLAARPGPVGGRTGSVTGFVHVVQPGFDEVPQRAESHLFGGHVLSHSGEFVLEETDLELGAPGRGIEYHFRRRYESRHGFQGALGRNWEHEYEDRRLYPSLAAGNIVRASGRGSFEEYLADSEGGFVSPVGVFARLFADGEGFLVEREPDGTRYRYHPLDGEATAGRLESITDRAGNRIACLRDARGWLATVRDSVGRTVTYVHDAAGRITGIADSTGRAVTFAYDAAGDLVAVTRPAVLATPTENNFPAGKRTEYVYSTGFAEAPLNHNLLQIIDPREAMGGTRKPRLVVEYGQDPAALAFDRVVRYVTGGTNATGVAAGGTVTVTYEASAQALPPGAPDADLLEASLLATAGTTRYVDEVGVLHEVTWSGAGLPLSLRIHTRDLPNRPRDAANLHPPPGTAPPYYETRWTWTREGLLASLTHPRGDRELFTYDEGSPVRHAQAALLRREHQPVPSASGAGVPAITTYLRDPLFGVVVEEVAPRGNDPGHVPPLGGAAGPERYRTSRTLDYQEGATASSLGAAAGLDEADLAAALDRAGIALGLGDVNGDGQLAGGEEQPIAGHVLRETLPPATLPPDADGGNVTIDASFTTFVHNRFGQLVGRTDGSGRLTRYEYHPELDFDGDGTPTPGEGLDPVTGGFLARRLEDHGTSSGHREVIVESLVYDGRGQVAKRTDGRGNERIYFHNELGQLVELRLPPPLRYRWHWIYDEDDHLVRYRIENYTSTDGGAHFLVSDNRFVDTDLEVDLLGQLVTITREVSEGEVGPARSLVTRHRYDAAGRLVRTIHPIAGSDEAFDRDERGLVIAHRRGAGTADEAVTTSYLDEAGNPVLRLGPAPDAVEERRYDGFGRLAATIDAVGGVVVIERDIEGQALIESRLGAAGGPTPTGREGDGNVLLERLCRAYDERGRAFELRRSRFAPGEATADVLVERFTHDGAGRLVRKLDPEGGVWTWEHDGAGRVVRATEPHGTLTTYTLDDAGNPVREVREMATLAPVDPSRAGDPEYTSDGRYRETSSVLRVFDARGRLTLLVDPGGGVWRARYDSRDNLLLVSDSVGSGINASADPELTPILGFLTDVQRGSLNDHGNRRRAIYDNLNRPVEVQHELRKEGSGGAGIDVENPFNRDGIITERLEWDDDGRLQTWIDDNGSATQLLHDGAGYVARKVWPDGTFEVHRRDRGGRLVELTDTAGAVFTQRFDALGRLVERSIARASGFEGSSLQRFEYDGLSRLTLAFDDNSPDDSADDSLVLRRHDSCGNVIEDVQDGFAVLTAYDRGSRPVAITYPGGRVVTMDRDAAGRLALLADASGPLASYRHFGSGRLLEKVLPVSGLKLSYLRPETGGVLRNTAYDAFGSILRHVYAGADGTPVHGFEYGRDRAGNKLYELALHRIDGLGDVWRYDSVYRIQRYLPNVFDPRVPPDDPLEKIVFYPDGNHSWRFLEVDFSVRRLEVNARSAITESDDDPLEYDARGDLARAGNLTFAHDALGRLRSVRRSGRLVATYRYDALGAEDPDSCAGRGRRVAKDVALPATGQPAGFVRFIYSGEGVIEERAADAQMLQQLVREDGGRPAQLVSQLPGVSPTIHELLHDAAGSVTAALDATGQPFETYRYGLHGQPVIINRFGNPIEHSALGLTALFAGQQHDFEIGMHSLGARTFDPAFGRFISDGSGLHPAGLLHLNGYLLPGLPGLPGQIPGAGSPIRGAAYLEPFQLRVPRVAGPSDIPGAPQS